MSASPFRLATNRHAASRRLAFDRVARTASESGLVRVPLRLTEIDTGALNAWRRTWYGNHPSGGGGWNWDRIAKPLSRRPTAFHLAIWSGDHLCGLAAGRMSARRRSGVRHMVSLHYIEAWHSPRNPLRGQIAFLSVMAAETYAGAFGATRIRLVDPLPGVLRIYEALGFTVAWVGERPVYCEREILR